jgi:hypothetical protein
MVCSAKCKISTQKYDAIKKNLAGDRNYVPSRAKAGERK